MSRIFFWQRIPLRVQGLIFNSLPLLAVLLTAAFAFFSNQQREHMEMSVNRHFEMIENLIDLQTQLLNAAVGLRGYLLTNSPSFLESYVEAREIIPQKLASVTALIESIPKPGRRDEKLARFAAVQGQVETQLESLAGLVPTGEDAGDSPALAADTDHSTEILRDQPLLKAASGQLARLRSDEQRLLGKRLEDIRTVRHRDFLLIFLSVVVGLASRAVALYFFHRRVVRRVRQLTENARSLRDGSAIVHEPSNHGDDIGELERELALIGDYLAERRTTGA
jgi:CHASE3 domain sensor protein